MFLALSSRCDFNLIALDNTVHTDVGLIKYAWTVYQVYVSIYEYKKNYSYFVFSSPENYKWEKLTITSDY